MKDSAFYRRISELPRAKGREIAKQLSLKLRSEYNKNPQLCLLCKKPLSYDQKRNHNKFCSCSCAAKYNNMFDKDGILKHPKRNCKRCGAILSYKTKGDYCKKCIADANIEYKINNNIEIDPAVLRRYVIKTRGNKCENPECGIETWCGEPAPIDLHHKDGNHKNNKLENLELLCKNCHALTDTYGIKNIGHGRPDKRRRR